MWQDVDFNFESYSEKVIFDPRHLYDVLEKAKLQRSKGDCQKLVERHELGEHRLLEQWNYSVLYYDGRYVALYICSSS